MRSRIMSSMFLALLIVTLAVGCAEAEKPISVAELLEIGEKFLLELNYEMAVV